LNHKKKEEHKMLDPVTLQRLAEIRQQEYLQMAEQMRLVQPGRSVLWQAGEAMIALGKRLMATTAPAQTVTAPDMTEPCVEC
jgi:hypothetical protein